MTTLFTSILRGARQQPLVPRAASLLVLLVLGSTPLRAQNDVAGLLPADTLMHLEITGEPCTRASEDLAVAKIWREPEVQQFVQQLSAMAGVGLAGARMQLQAMTGLGPEAVNAMLRGRWSASWAGGSMRTQEYSYEINGEQHTYTSTNYIPKLLVTFEYREVEGVVDEIVASLEQLLVNQSGGRVAISDLGLEGRTVRMMSALDEEMPFDLLYFVENDRLVFATDRELLASVILRMKGDAGPPLASSSEYQSVRARVGNRNSVVFCYLALGKVLPLLAEQTGEDDFLALQEIVPYSAMGYGMDLDGPGIRDRLYYTLLPGSKAAGLLSAPPGPLHSLRILPADAGIAAGYSLPMAQWVDYAFDALEALNPGGRGSLHRALESVDAMLGFSLRDELLPAMGPELAFYASFPGNALLPDLGLVVQVQDAEKVLTALDRLFVQAAGRGPRQVEFRGQTLHYSEIGGRNQLGDLDLTLRPTWTLLGDHLIFTLWPQAAKNIVAGVQDGRPRLADNPDFAALLQGFDGGRRQNLSGYFYADLRGAVEFLLDNGAPVVQSMLPAGPAIPLDAAAWPTTESVTQHLFGMFSGSRYDGGGYYTEFYSPTGLILPYSTLVGAAVFLSVRSVESSIATIEEEY